MDRFYFDQFLSATPGKDKQPPLTLTIPSENRGDKQFKLVDGEEKSHLEVWAKKGDKTPGTICGLGKYKIYVCSTGLLSNILYS